LIGFILTYTYIYIQEKATGEESVGMIEAQAIDHPERSVRFLWWNHDSVLGRDTVPQSAAQTGMTRMTDVEDDRHVLFVVSILFSSRTTLHILSSCCY
jgi:hypothetical protein